MFMRLLFIAFVLTLAACGKPKPAKPAVEPLSFLPKECTFVQNEVADTRYASGNVDKYSCTSELSNMDCFAYAQGEESLYLTCELISSSVPQGVPSECAPYHDGEAVHEFLDGSILDSLIYDCGTMNDNLRCFYFSEPTGPREELRCNLM
jgi:hypothetical protein